MAHLIANDVQANIGRSAKPNWSMYLFFRVLSDKEQTLFKQDIDQEINRQSDLKSKAAMGQNTEPRAEDENFYETASTLLQESRRHALSSDKNNFTDKKAAGAFFYWLNDILGKKSKKNKQELKKLQDTLAPLKEEFEPFFEEQRKFIEAKLRGIEKLNTKSSQESSFQLNTSSQLNYSKPRPKISDIYRSSRKRDIKITRDANNQQNTLPVASARAIRKEIPSTLKETGEKAIKGGLVATLLHLLARNLTNESNTRDSNLAIFPENKQKKGKLPINIGFTAAGMEFLGVNKEVVATFPDAFREGMAARSKILGDVGPSSPEHWEGALGQRNIHGILWSSFPAENIENMYWEILRSEVEDYNKRVKNEHASDSRNLIGILFNLVGLELLHIELGEVAAKNANPMQKPEYPEYHTEHFGFRDGISQPFVDMGLGRPGLGGGSPSRANSWEPVAPGEIFLGHLDEDNQLATQPAIPELRQNGTYMVFRKLEQDVVGFREFLASKYPDDGTAQSKLAAQMVGRWQNGTSLVTSPLTPKKVEEIQINNFRYSDQDPHGAKCPLGAHVRRANPRDIGERDSVKRHRILRRSMSYGGPLLPKRSNDTTQKKGLLFVAMNSRIDVQFELIQSRWLNGGDFLGQAGLDKCPLTGPNEGKSSDKFHESGAISPVRGIPRFVTTKGGDYFFIPGLNALKKIATQDFKTAPKSLDKGDSAGRPTTRGLFDESRLKDISVKIGSGKANAVKVTPPGPIISDDEASKPITFFGKYADVVEILRGSLKGEKPKFSTKHYYEAGKLLTRGDEILLGLDDGGPNKQARKMMLNILKQSWLLLGVSITRNLSNEEIKYSAKLMLKEKLDSKNALEQKEALKLFQKDLEILRNQSNLALKEINDPKNTNSQKMNALSGIPYNKIDTILAGAVKQIAQMRTVTALQRVGPAGQMDLCQDFATDVAYSICAGLYGVRGPNWITELAVSLRFAKLNIGAVHPDWLAAISGKTPKFPEVTTLQVWSITNFVALVGNIELQKELSVLSRQAGSELLNHLDGLIANAKLTRTDESIPKNLLECFVKLESAFVSSKLSKDQYYIYVRSLLAELVSSTMTLIPSVYGKLMGQIMREDWELPTVLPKLQNQKNGIRKFIYELDRLEPSIKLLLRYCEEKTTLSNVNLRPGDWVGALVGAANFDPNLFPDPTNFVWPWEEKPERNLENYLMFGAPVGKGEHSCWGRDRVALVAFEEMIKASAQLHGLRRVAGPIGEPVSFAGVTIGLKARFAAFEAHS